MARLAALLAPALLAAAPAAAYTPADVHRPLAARPAPGGALEFQGRIVPESVEAVRAALARTPAARAVLLDSPGGSIEAALAIGRLLRARGLDTAVPTGADCASACVLVLAAGVRRSIGPGAGVGVHRLVDWTTYSRTWDVYRVVRRAGTVSRELLSRRVLSSREVYTEAPPRAYAAVRAYLAEMGEAPSLVTLMRATPAASLHWMTAAELSATRLSTGGDAAPRG